jgi:hypothetical protein
VECNIGSRRNLQLSAPGCVGRDELLHVAVGEGGNGLRKECDNVCRGGGGGAWPPCQR